MTKPRLPLHRIPLAVSLITLAGAVACGGESELPHDARVEAGLQQVLDRAVASPGVFLPGAATYYRDSTHAAWSGSAGLRDLQGATPMQPGNRIRAGSILKTLVATVTLQHVEEGRLSLDQTLSELLPATVTDRVANADRISLRMLLNHTSGIPEWVDDAVDAAVVADPGHVWTNDQAIDIAATRPPTFEPGTSWAYSNTNYTLLGMVLDRAGGASWRAQVFWRVLVPLGLTSTELPEPGDRAITDLHAHGYVDLGGTTVDLSHVDPSMAGAAGGNAMVTTVRDLATFLDALLAGRLFARPETLVAMTTMVEAPDESGLPHWYGLGLEAYETDGLRVVGHAGGAAGYATMMFRIPAHDATLVTTATTDDLFTNALNLFLPSIEVITAPAEGSRLR